MLLRRFGLILVLFVAVNGQFPEQPICNMRCGNDYQPVCVRQTDGISREFNNPCQLSLYNCQSNQKLRPNTACMRDIVQDAVRDALRRLPSASNFQLRNIREFIGALRRLARSL
ncbi:unnamed protein product [Hermetia illucens]|uniref:Kazal-like domain-containing protein n=1 Tax=Hermetia illucens TaxID=343691 RepID=A0A7R8YXB7_HERIL|nr:uncharacterized protein LOC119655673 [Hermetia illucens]CAD7087737.1 unnamed protein product [Hermetia illucens]